MWLYARTFSLLSPTPLRLLELSFLSSKLRVPYTLSPPKTIPPHLLKGYKHHPGVSPSRWAGAAGSEFKRRREWCIYREKKHHTEQHQSHSGLRATQEQVWTYYHSCHCPNAKDLALLIIFPFHCPQVLRLPDLPQGKNRYPRKQKDSRTCGQQPRPPFRHFLSLGTTLLQ